jgi:hypothetical protein
MGGGEIAAIIIGSILGFLLLSFIIIALMEKYVITSAITSFGSITMDSQDNQVPQGSQGVANTKENFTNMPIYSRPPINLPSSVYAEANPSSINDMVSTQSNQPSILTVELPNGFKQPTFPYGPLQHINTSNPTPHLFGIGSDATLNHNLHFNTVVRNATTGGASSKIRIPLQFQSSYQDNTELAVNEIVNKMDKEPLIMRNLIHANHHNRR